MTLEYIYLAAIGLSWIITDSYIFEPVRKIIGENADAYPNSKLWDMIDYVFNCMICMSMWTFIPFYALSIYAFGFSKSSFFIAIHMI